MTESSAPSTPDGPAATHDSRGRGIAVAICLVLAGLLTTPAAVAYWGQRTINDSTRYVDTVGPLVSSPEVQTAVATKVTDALERQVDVEAILNEAFAGVITQRPRLEALVGPLAGAINGLIETQVRTFLASDEFAEFWVTANTRLQQGLVRVLEGETSGVVSQEGDEVVLDVSEVIERVKERLVARGLTMVENVPTANADRKIVLFDAPQLRQARNAYAIFNPVAKWLLAVVAVLYLAALVFSRRRARTTVVIGSLLVANSLLMAFALSVGETLFKDALSATEFAPASGIVYDTLLTYLMRAQRVLIWLGLILVVAGWYLGRNAYGTAVRTTVREGVEAAGAALADTPVAGPGRWVVVNARWLRVVIVVIGGVILVWGNQVTEKNLFWATVVVLALLAVLQVLVGTGRAARRAADAGTPSSRGGEPPDTLAGTAASREAGSS
jgi:hypothetical protein